MKTSLRLSIATALLALSLPAAASAQGGMGGGMRGGMGGGSPEMQAQMRARMFEGITLTAEQSAKIDTIQAATRTKRMELRQSSGGDRQQMMQQSMELMQEEAKAIKALLTPEQAAIFDKNREALMQRRGGGVR